MIGPKELPRIPDQGHPILPIEPPPPPPPPGHREPRTDPAPPLAPDEDAGPATAPDHEQHHLSPGLRFGRRAPLGSNPDDTLEDLEVIDRGGDEQASAPRRISPPRGVDVRGISSGLAIILSR